KSWVNSCRSSGVRARQWRASARLAVSATSKISLAILRTASRRSLGLSAGSSSTLVTWSLYSRSWSVGAPARAGVDTPTTRMNPRRIAAIVFIMIGSIQRRGARAPGERANRRSRRADEVHHPQRVEARASVHEPAPPRAADERRRGRRRREDTHLRRAHMQDVDEEQRMRRRLDPAAGAEEKRRD